MEISVRTDVERGSSTASIAGRPAGRLGFTIAGDREGTDVWTLYTTVVDPAFGGSGVGSALVRDVIGRADAAGALVNPTCWFIAGWLDRHPEFHHLLADDLR